MISVIIIIIIIMIIIYYYLLLFIILLQIASMMEQISVEKRLQISCEDDDKETNLAKRMKSGSVTGKSVVVLRHSDVTIGLSSVLMPNTIEMAQLKKPLKGQFKRNVEFSSEMSELDVKRALTENFPILKDER